MRGRTPRPPGWGGGIHLQTWDGILDGKCVYHVPVPMQGHGGTPRRGPRWGFPKAEAGFLGKRMRQSSSVTGALGTVW